MTGILIITHGELGTSLLKSCEMITGNIKNCYTLSLNRDDDINILEKKVFTKIQNMKKAGDVIVLVDLMGGSPSNIAFKVLKKIGGFRIITGINLPLLISISIYRDSIKGNELLNKVVQEAINSIKIL